MEAIIKDLDDNDLYKESMGQAVFNQFPHAIAHYRYFNRAKDKQYPVGFANRLQEQIEMMGDLRRTNLMDKFYAERTPWLKPTFRQWRKNYHYDPKQVKIEQSGGELQIDIQGPWFEAIYWEVPLLALITQLRRTNPTTGSIFDKRAGWEQAITDKGNRLADADVKFIEFGTRRRYDVATQLEVNKRLRSFPNHYRGTSNPWIACTFNVPVMGTFAHEWVMGMGALYGLQEANKRAMDHWIAEYHGDNGIALSDTFTTPKFLETFDAYYARLFDGVRQDSGDPFEIGRMVISHYKKLRIDPTTKVLVFSDSLNVDKAIALNNEFGKQIRVTMGIGTHFTNDVGYEPSNHVIKLVEADFGQGMVPTIKLSDDKGKNLGGDAAIADALRQLRLVAQ